MQKKSIKVGLLTGFLEVIYITLVALFLWGGSSWFNKSNNVLISIIMLLIFVISMAVSGFLVFGYPVYLFLKKKDFKEAALTSALSVLVIVISLILFLSIYFLNYSSC
ncbi:MAG: hypothetical protein U5L76_00960 [Patescibacteria group bacterium]|nr:hypothetical protein [Patescibacteria group bacterium]